MKFTPVYVEWVDHCSDNMVWAPLEHAESMDTRLIQSLGFIVRESEFELVLTTSLDLPNNICGVLAIDKRTIERRVELDLGELADNDG